MAICRVCSSELNRKSDICKSCYYKEYHLRTYQNKERFCRTCSKTLKGMPPSSKKCATCSVKCTCKNCKKDFVSKNQIFPLCPRCQYYWYKENFPLNAEKAKNKSNSIFCIRRAEKLRIKKNLPLDTVLRGKGPKEEGYLNNKGYRLMIKKESETGKYRRVYKHVLVMEEHLGRKLMKGETVHHKNGVRDDNRLENLELWNKGQPAGQRVEDRIKYYIAFLSEYGYKLVKE
jgi:hypothetical protein